MFKTNHIRLYFCLFLAIVANGAIWLSTSHRIVRWANVPPAPTALGLSAAFLGDEMLAYRFVALSLQTFGNTSGDFRPLKDYNYDHLKTWFDVADTLDSRSEYVPFLAGYYFSATQNPEQLRPLIEYLRRIGKRPEGEKWRWLAQTVYLARHRLNDMEFARKLAKELAATYRPGMPAWPLQMEAIIASDMGDKETAYAMMLEMIKSGEKTMDPAEINFMVDYICTRLLDAKEKGTNPLCKTEGPSRSR